MKKPIITAAKPVAKVKEKTPVVAKVAAPKPVPAKKAPAKVKAVTPKAVVAPKASSLTMTERVGLTSGSIWHYLTKNGATSVSVLVKALIEEEKIIQRSIGWLAQEGKITLETVGRTETIALKK